MPHPARTLPPFLLNVLTTAANALVAMIIFFILKYTIELPFRCACSRGIHTYDIMYIFAPPFIIFLLVFIIDKHQRRLFCCYQSLEDKHFNRCSFVVEQFLRLLWICFFWIAAVFLDGDWYECYKATIGTVCKNQTLSTEKNQLNPHHRNDSLVIGLSLTMAGVGLWAVWSCCRMNCSCCQPYNQKLREHLKNIREQEKQQKRQNVTDYTEQKCDTAHGQLANEANPTRDQLINAPEENDCLSCLSECFCMFCLMFCKKCKCKPICSAPWHTMFNRSDIIESRDVSLFNRHLQKEIEAEVERQMQVIAKTTAAVITETRFRELKTALQINDQPQPDGALLNNNPPQSQSDEEAPSTQSSTDKPGQEGKASATENQPGPSSHHSFSPGVNVQPLHQSEPEAEEGDVLLNNPDEEATSAASSLFIDQRGQEGKASPTEQFEMTTRTKLLH